MSLGAREEHVGEQELGLHDRLQTWSLACGLNLKTLLVIL